MLRKANDGRTTGITARILIARPIGVNVDCAWSSTSAFTSLFAACRLSSVFAWAAFGHEHIDNPLPLLSTQRIISSGERA